MKADLIVIGGGSGGVRAARLAAGLGKKVTLIEKSHLGGTCVNLGCVPKKLFYYAAEFAQKNRLAAAYGWGEQAAGHFNWSVLIANKNAEIERLNRVYHRLLKTAGVTLVEGAAHLLNANTVGVGGQEYQADKILLACGGQPTRLAISGSDYAVVSDDLFHLTELPKRIAVIGGGYIALEFAGIFAGLGAQVTISYRAELPMRGLDEDIRQHLAAGMRAQNINIMAGTSPTAIVKTAGGKVLQLDDGKQIEADLIVSAVGRRPVSDALNLSAAGVEVRPNGTVPVNADFQTSCPNIYAVGDLLSTTALTPVAIAEAAVFVQRVYQGNTTATVDYAGVPTAIFSSPQVATVGLSEATAIKQNTPIDVYCTEFKAMKTAFGKSEETTLVKLIVDKPSNRVLGAQMVGDNASEIMQGIAVAINAGATKQHFDNTVGIHPTTAEEFVTLRESCRSFGGDKP